MESDRTCNPREFIPDSYWARPGLLLAGEYPSAPDEDSARFKTRGLVDCGIRTVVDLTVERERSLRPYLPLLLEAAAERGVAVTHRRMAVPDLGTPSGGLMKEILDAIDASIGEGRPVYVHCFGGIGRTGTVVGCHFVRHGLDGEAALRRIAVLREGTPDGWLPSPEMSGQREMVRRWRKGE